MKAIPLLLAALLCLALALPTSSAAPCIDTGSQWKACVEGGCVVLDGPMIHKEYCLAVVALPAICTTELGQWQACVDWPCVVLDGPALHVERCVRPVTA